jgi:hypothetical protein
MSFNAKPNKPDSRDTAKLRSEYEKKKQEFRDSGDAASKVKLRDDAAKLFQRVVTQQTHERRESLREKQKVLSGMGLYRTDAQMKAEREKVNAETARRVAAENSR